MTPAQAMAAKVKAKTSVEQNIIEAPENTIPNEEEIEMDNNNIPTTEPANVQTPEAMISIPVSGVSALITALTDTQKNLMNFKFHDVSAGEITEFLSNISNIQQCVQYLGEIVKNNYEQQM